MLIGPRRRRSEPHERARGVAPRVRLGIAAVFVAVIALASDLERDERVVLIGVTLAYAALTLVLETVARRSDGSRLAPTTVAEALLGLVTIFAVTIIVPELQPAAWVLYALSIVAYTTIGGPVLGLILSAATLAGAAIADAVAPADERVGISVALGLVVLPALVVAADLVSRRRRRRAAQLAELHRALRAFTVTPDLEATLDSILDSVAGALGATAAGVLLAEDDALVVASVHGTRSGRAPFERALGVGSGDSSPFERAKERRETVVVSDARADARFPEWSRAAHGAPAGFAALVAVPLRLGGDVLGVLGAVFSQRGGLDHDDLALLEAYAEQAALVIVRAQAYERERLAADQVAEATRRKDEFLGMVSHELRTPLTAAKGFVDTVLLHWDRLPEARRRELLLRASGNADELARLVGQLLDFSRVDTDGVELDPVPLGLAGTIEDVLGDLEPVLAGHRIGVRVRPGIVVWADRDAVTHVLGNLLTNAVKFSPAGSRVSVSAAATGDEVVVSVSDQGRGITPDDQARIFERFYQADAAAPQRGTGIGLTIVRRFVELHGGRVWVDSVPGRGATFSFTLPAAAPAPAPSTARSAEPGPPPLEVP